MDTNQAAKYLGVTRQRVLKLVEQERLHPTKFGNSYVYTKEDLDAYQATPKRKPGPKPKTET